jgi:hypothetical protein
MVGCSGVTIGRGRDSIRCRHQRKTSELPHKLPDSRKMGSGVAVVLRTSRSSAWDPEAPYGHRHVSTQWRRAHSRVSACPGEGPRDRRRRLLSSSGCRHRVFARAYAAPVKERMGARVGSRLASMVLFRRGARAAVGSQRTAEASWTTWAGPRQIFNARPSCFQLLGRNCFSIGTNSVK